MTRLVLSWRRTHDDALPSFRVIDAFPAVIGRGLDCDLIVADPYVSARQAAIRVAESGWEICDLSDRNPTQLNGRALAEGAWRPLQSGDSIVLGRTEMMAYAPDHAVAPALPLPREGGFSALFARPWLSAAVFAAALAAAGAYAYLEIWSDEPAMASALMVAAAFFVMTVWAGLWSVVGRLAVNRSRFVMQLGMVACYIVVALVVSALLRGVDFLLSGSWLSQGLSVAAQMVLLTALAYGCLGAATGLDPRRRVQGAASFAGGLLLSIMSLSAIGAMGFTPSPPFSSSLSPSLARFAQAVPAESFMADSAALFDDPQFASPPVASDAAQQQP